MEDTELERYFEAIGISAVKNNFSTFIDHGVSLIKNAGTPNGCEHDPSCINIASPIPNREANVLVIDIGGTHTKAGVVEHLRPGERSWCVLFDRENDYFDVGNATLPLHRYSASLANQLAISLQHEGIPLNRIDGIGIIWSNGLSAKRFENKPGNPRGTTALVTGAGGESAYRKGEFFVKGLTDGIDLGEIFLKDMYSVGLTPKAFIIGNDTVFTLKAIPNADAGLVASTGANATDVDETGEIFNTEIGGWCRIPDSLLSKGDLILLQEEGKKDIKLEDLIAGKCLPRVFEGHVIALAKAGMTCLNHSAEIFERETQGTVKSHHVSGLLKHEAELHEILCNDELQHIYEKLARRLARRSGMLCAGLAYFSLYNQLQRKDHVVVSMDSSQARHMAGYYERMQDTLTKLVGPDKTAEAVLLVPEGMITVPMRGLAEAVINELAVM